jgi:hypothetical protein
VEEEWDPVCCLVEPRREGISCGSEIPPAVSGGVAVSCVGAGWVEGMGFVAGAG